MKNILDLGSGYDTTHNPIYPKTAKENVIRVDIKGAYMNVKHNLNEYPYPLPSNHFDEIYLNHSEYYIKDKKRLMEEIYKMAKPNAKVIIRSIHASRWNARRIKNSHPFFVDIKSFYKFTPKFQVKKVKLHYFVWQGNGIKHILAKPIDFFANLNPTLCERVWIYRIGGFNEIYAELVVKK